MQTLLLRLSVALTRGWTRVYTWRTASTEGNDRRREIDSDLWELVNDPEAGSHGTKAAHVFVRLIAGVREDIGWRIERAGSDDQLRIRRTVSVMAAMLVVISLWIVPSLLGLGLRGHAQVLDCAATAPTPFSTADLRIQVMECAGAFFVAR